MPNGCTKTINVPHRLLEIADVTQQHQQQRDVEHPAEEPGPLAGLEQALEKHHLARQPQATPPVVVGAGVVGISSGAGVRA